MGSYVKNFSNDLNFSASRIIDPGFDNQIFDLKFMQGETTMYSNIYLKKLKQKLNLTLKVGSFWAVFPKVFELGPILPTLTKLEGFLRQNYHLWLKIGLYCQEKASFLLILSESVEPIFQSVGPISRHTALEGTLLLGLFKVLGMIMHSTHAQLRPQPQENNNIVLGLSGLPCLSRALAWH